VSTCPSAPQTALLCTPKKRKSVLSQYAYEIWLHILVHLSGNFPFKAAGMKLDHFAWKFQLCLLPEV